MTQPGDACPFYHSKIPIQHTLTGSRLLKPAVYATIPMDSRAFRSFTYFSTRVHTRARWNANIIVPEVHRSLPINTASALCGCIHLIRLLGDLRSSGCANFNETLKEKSLEANEYFIVDHYLCQQTDWNLFIMPA